MPKKEIAIFVIIDIVLVAAVLVAVFHHLPVVYVIGAFTFLSVLNGVFLIVTVVKKTGNG